MNLRVWKIAVAVSVALNLFIIAGGIAAWVRWNADQAQIEEARRPPPGGPTMAAMEEVDPMTRRRVRQAMRASALAARPDFQESRRARREAVVMARGDSFDPAAAAGLLRRSREAELRGRARLETDTVAILATLEPADRQLMAPILARPGRGGGQGRDRMRVGPRGPVAAERDVPPELP